jgi:hypothetical protein
MDFNKECYENNIINKNEYNEIEKIFQDFQEYLSNFNNPCLLHCDISTNNIRIIQKDNVKKILFFLNI